jgi:hypothetical protein
MIVRKDKKSAPAFNLLNGETILPFFFDKEDAIKWSSKQKAEVLDMNEHEVILADVFGSINTATKKVIMFHYDNEWRYLTPEWKKIDPLNGFTGGPFGSNLFGGL